MTITIPANEAEWHNLVSTEVPTTAANWRELARVLTRKVEEIGPATLDREFFNIVLGETDMIRDREATLLALVEAFIEEEDVPVEDAALEREIWEAVLIAHSRASVWSRDKRDAVTKTAAHQYSNWVAGRYEVASVKDAVSQFGRRVRRAHPGVEVQASSFVYWSLMKWLMDKKAGLNTRPRKPISNSRYDVEDEIVRLAGEMGVESGAEKSVLARAAASILSPYSSEEDIPSDLGQKFIDWVRGYSSSQTTVEAAELVAEYYLEHHLGQPSVTVSAVTDVPTLEAALIAREGMIETFQQSAIKKGLAELVYQVRQDEITKGQLIDVLRLNIRSYGHQRFTGGGRTRLLAMLAVVEALRGTPLTAEEWKTRWEQFMDRVQAVSGRYGEKHNMCERLEDANKELGLVLQRYPADRSALFTSRDLVLRVPVHTWYVDTAQLKQKAMEVWEGLSPKERKAAVVEQKGVHVDWSKMTAK